MPFFLPPVSPLPKGISLRGQTAIVTGASSGIGTELAAQLLELGASTLIMAVRNVSKGETVRSSVLARPTVKTANPNAVVKVMKVDIEDYESVQTFAKAFRAEHSELHILMLNAGIGTLKREMTRSGHEKNVQVNYLSNVLLMLELLPLLNATADKTGKPARVTWTGSRAHGTTSLAKKAPLKPGETVLGHFDGEESFVPFTRYGDSKLLPVLFMYEMRDHLPSDKVIINNYCPAMTDTPMSDILPIYLRLPMNAVKAVRARSVEKAAWIGLNAALVAGPESHGQFLSDKDVAK
jgi:NAD(P)-dependent dehydrogenase (short-subunit alcohol dehydrogenase family)